MNLHQHPFPQDNSLSRLLSSYVIEQYTDKESGRRLYRTSNEDAAPAVSITTLLGDDPEKKKSLAQWRNKVGATEANRVSKFASGRGTKLHSVLESFLMGKEIDTEQLLPHIRSLFLQAKDELIEHVGKVFIQEQRLIAPSLGIAGTVDAIVEWDGVLSVLDFKTSQKMKKKEWIDDYFIQGAAYRQMLREMTKDVSIETPVEQIVIFIVGDEGNQCFKEQASDWTPELLSRIHKYYLRNSPESTPRIFNRGNP